MGTRGCYGFRKDGIDKLTYNHWDSYPSGLGYDILDFCKSHSVEDMKALFDKIVMVNERSVPTEEEINYCVENGWVDLSVGNQSTNDWYCLLRNLQGNLEKLSTAKTKGYMIDNHDFIKDSVWCEYAYVINLDEEVLEFYEGFQHVPQKGNRYGESDNRGYYPCKLSLTFSLDEIKKIENMNAIIEQMECQEDE